MKLIIKEIKKGKTYYVNILIKNKNTNELITFKPIVITYNDILFSKLENCSYNNINYYYYNMYNINS